MQPSFHPTFVHRRRIQYYETDAMGVVHHSNHIRIFEEARVEWLRARDLTNIHVPYGKLVFAVIEAKLKYLKPLGFDEEIEVITQSRLVGVRLFFQYAIWSAKQRQFAALGETELVPLTQDFKPSKLPTEAVEAYKLEPWDSQWPPKWP